MSNNKAVHHEIVRYALDSIATPAGVIQLDSNYHHPVLRCLAENDGKELWRYAFNSNSGADLSCQLTNGNILISEERNPSGLAYLDEIDSTTGLLVNQRLMDLGRWDSERRYLYGKGGQIPGPGDWLYLSNGLTTVTLMGGVRGAMHGLLWTNLENNWIDPVAGTNFLYMGLKRDFSVLALDKRAERVWKTRMPANDSPYNSAGSADMAVTPKFLIYVFGNRIYAFDRYSGRIAWKSDRNIDVMYGPIVTGDVIYVSTLNKPGRYYPNAITAFSLTTGRVLWTKIMGVSIMHIIAHRGALYVVDRLEDNQYWLMRLNQAGSLGQRRHDQDRQYRGDGVRAAGPPRAQARGRARRRDSSPSEVAAALVRWQPDFGTGLHRGYKCLIYY